MEKQCCICRHFTAYFEKAYCCYLRTDCGNCSTRGETVNKKFTCDNWAPKFGNTIIKPTMVINGLADAITNISVIKDFLEEHFEK
ncbi:MAG: hypothetical protein K2G96_00730 [Clostridia bacterium]|nr:hypothetical protein [Clostridia bacterium]